MKSRGTDPRTIVHAAAILFDDAGYHTTSLADIARSVGLSKGAIYYHFETKDSILQAMHGVFTEALEKSVDELITPASDPRERVSAVIMGIVSLMATHRPYVRTYFENRRDLGREGKAAVRAKRRAFEDILIEAIEDGVLQNMFVVDDPRRTALWILGMSNWCYQWFRGTPEDARDLGNQISAFALRGLQGAPSSS